MNEVAHATNTPKPRRRFTLQQKADYLERFLQSGLSQAEFCRQAHLTPSCLERWLKLIEPSPQAQEVAAHQSPLLFQELALPKPLANACWSVELSRANGTVLRLAQPLSLQLLEQLLRVC